MESTFPFPNARDHRSPKADSYFPATRTDPSAAQYSTVRSNQASTNGSSMRMQRLTENPQTSRSQNRDPNQRSVVTTQANRYPSKQDVDKSNGAGMRNDFTPISVQSKDDVTSEPISYTDWKAQTNQGIPGHEENIPSSAMKVKKPSNDRIRHILQRSSGNLSSAAQAPSMEALTTAIRNGLNPSEPIRRPEPVRTRTDPMVRLPFQEEPDSPSSTYTDMTSSQARPQSVPLSTYHGYDYRDSRPSTIQEHEAEDYDRSGIDTGLPTPNSINPFFGNEHPGMSSKIPASKRPPKLDIGAVRDMESRGSVTSLPDLIRRATRLAGNLDKGKTASRLGLLDFFGGNERTRDPNHRDSSFSDVLDSFPATGSPNRDRPTTLWPDGQKQAMSDPSATNPQKTPEKKKQRRCCGMSPMWFSIVLVTIGLLVAAAVLIPLFLIVLPHAHTPTNSNKCTSHSCSNGGFSVLVNNACSCICVGGFTGNDCSAAKDPECTIFDLKSDTRTFSNATVGTSILSVFESSQNTFNINLNQTNLLSIFANTNLSCTSENSLVEFVSGTTMRSKRYVMLPGMMSTDQHVPALNLPATESKEYRRFFIVDEEEPEDLTSLPSRGVHPRENTISSNGIVFATSTNTATSQLAAATTTASSPQTTFSGISDKQIAFAGTVVLYVLQAFEQVNVAVAANQAIASFFKATSRQNSTVGVVSGSQKIDANFDKLQIVLANGTVLGGQ